MSFPERATVTTFDSENGPVVITRATIHGVAETCAFAISDIDGGQVFVPARLAERLKPQVGERFEVHLRPNRVNPSKTPWFAAFMSPLEGDVCGLSSASILRVLRVGGVWTPENMADEVGGDGSDGHTSQAAALLESLYRLGECAKFVLFTRPGVAQTQAWYTAYPDRADVDEWEETDD